MHKFVVCFEMGPKDTFGDGHFTSRKKVAQAPELLDPKRPRNIQIFFNNLINLFSAVGKNLGTLG